MSQKSLSLEIGQESTTKIAQLELEKHKCFNLEHLYKIAKHMWISVIY